MSGLKEEYLPKYTYEDYKNWEGKWELINGFPFAMTPAPRIEHQEVSGNIHYQLMSLLKSCKNCKALLPIDWRIPGEMDNNVLQPDNLVVCKNVKGIYLSDAPVLIFEILSPSTAFKDKQIKFEIYESQGVKYYVIADIDLKFAYVYELNDGAYQKIGEVKSDVVKFELESNCSIEFNFGEIWV